MVHGSLELFFGTLYSGGSKRRSAGIVLNFLNCFKKPNRNVGNKKYCKRNKECLFGFISTPDLNKQRISDLEDMSKGTSKSEMPRKKRK